MKNFLLVTNTAAAAAIVLAISSCTTQEPAAVKPAPTPVAPTPAAKAPEPAAKAPEPAKAKATKIAGDIGLLDTEKNYMIVVTKEGKLVTVDFDPKFQPTQRTPHPSKVADIGLGSSATVQYTKQGDKNIAQNVEYVPAKGE